MSDTENNAEAARRAVAESAARVAKLIDSAVESGHGLPAKNENALREKLDEFCEAFGVSLRE